MPIDPLDYHESYPLDNPLIGVPIDPLEEWGCLID